MILFRYLIREVSGSLLAVTFVLLLIFLSNQLVHYLSYAASGKLAANLLLQLLGFEIPYLLALLLPLGLYLGIILAYGRLYADSELGVMQACGFSQGRLMKVTGIFALFITFIVFLLMLWVNPLIIAQKERVLVEGMSAENIIQNLTPGRFQVSGDGKRVVYVEHISRRKKIADNLFFANQSKAGADEAAPASWSVVSAAKGYQAKDKNTKRSFLVAEEGYRYEGIPGQNDYKIIQFRKYEVEIPSVAVDTLRQEKEGVSSSELWQKYSDPNDAAELQWRLSIPLSAFLLALLAIPLSHVQPRQGRFSAVLPAVLIYVVYMNLLFVGRNWIEQKSVSVDLGLWWVHLLFIAVILSYLFFQSTFFRRMLRRL